MSDGETQSYRDGSRSYDSYEEMQEEKQKQLAGFAAEFLGMERKMLDLSNCGYGEPYWTSSRWQFKDEDIVDAFFSEKESFSIFYYPAVFMHLAKREMEKEFDISYMTFLSAGTLIHHYFFSERAHRTTKRQAVKDENNYRAFWPALEQAVKGECKHKWETFPPQEDGPLKTETTICKDCGLIKK